MMEQELREDSYDFRAHDRVWARVCPSLSPFPDIPPFSGASAPSPAEESRSGTASLGATGGSDNFTCCLGAEAMGSLPTISGFLCAEAASFRFERALAARAPDRYCRCTMEQLSRGGEQMFRQLSAVYYLIAASFPKTEAKQPCGALPCWTEGLRSVYYAEVCGGVNFARAARGITDPCLIRIFNELGILKGERANTVLQLLARHRQAGL